MADTMDPAMVVRVGAGPIEEMAVFVGREVTLPDTGECKSRCRTRRVRWAHGLRGFLR